MRVKSCFITRGIGNTCGKQLFHSEVDMMQEKKGFLIVNEYLNTIKFSQHSDWLLEAAKKAHLSIELRTNAEILSKLNGNMNNSYTESYGELPDFILFWDKDVRLAMYFEAMGIPVFNSSKAIGNCDDKSKTHLILSKAGISMPKTILAPMTFENIGYTNYNFLDEVVNTLSFPIVVKECYGSFGAQVYLSHTKDELLNIVRSIGTKAMLFQEYISSSEGRDIRLQVVGDKVITAMYRYSVNGDFRANISNGGKMKPYEPNDKEIELAIRSCKELGLDFAGVDLLFGNEDERFVCEVNSNAHFKNIFDCTGVNTADAIIKYIKESFYDLRMVDLR